MRAPYENFARSLLLQHRPQAVVIKLEGYGYPNADLPYLQLLHASLRASRPLPPDLRTHKMRRWLHDNKLYEMEVGTLAAHTAREMATDPRLRPVLELLLIAGIDYQETSDYLRDLCGRTYGEHTIAIFAHYFWNRDKMTPMDWRTFLFTTAEGVTQERYPGASDLYTCLAAAPEVALWKAGIDVDIAEQEMIRNIKNTAYVRFQECGVEPNTPTTAKKSRTWVAIWQRAMDETRHGPQAVTAMLARIHNMSMRLKAMPVRDARLLVEHNDNVVDLPEVTK